MNNYFPRSVRFKPWIGRNYESSSYFGVRLLVLGESHYGKDGPDARTTTHSVIQNNGVCSGSRTFTKLTKVLANQIDGKPSAETRHNVWHSLVFYNLIQDFVSTTATKRAPPTLEMRRKAWKPFMDVLERCQPELLVVLGSVAKGEVLRNFVQISSLPLEICTLRHPAAALKYEEWCPVFQKHLQATRK